MHTLTLEVSEKTYPHLQYLIQNLPDVNIIEDIEIESISKNEDDYKEIQKIKSQNNKKYSLSETKKILGI